MPCFLPTASAARPRLLARLGCLAWPLLFVLCIESQELRLSTDESGGKQFVQAFQALQNISSTAQMNYIITLPAGARVNVSGLYGNPPGSSTWLSGRLN